MRLLGPHPIGNIATALTVHGPMRGVRGCHGSFGNLEKGGIRVQGGLKRILHIGLLRRHIDLVQVFNYEDLIAPVETLLEQVRSLLLIIFIQVLICPPAILEWIRVVNLRGFFNLVLQVLCAGGYGQGQCTNNLVAVLFKVVEFMATVSVQGCETPDIRQTTTTTPRLLVIATRYSIRIIHYLLECHLLLFGSYPCRFHTRSGGCGNIGARGILLHFRQDEAFAACHVKLEAICKGAMLERRVSNHHEGLVGVILNRGFPLKYNLIGRNLEIALLLRGADRYAALKLHNALDGVNSKIYFGEIQCYLFTP
ncbi:hypothetical protein FGO68_gene16222 [Halteria grandinella]|uniref:Uncharacterized protein n=1 Tax=Halteria grandinella TaxID=5974 RepID=A0A8J8NDC4_HALGN|nr:hypothetical protein FGO68_gene16222 [Halteria grandinella]